MRFAEGEETTISTFQSSTTSHRQKPVHSIRGLRDDVYVRDPAIGDCFSGYFSLPLLV